MGDFDSWYLGIDLGTSGLKVGAVDVTGKVLAVGYESIATRWIDGGGAEQDTDQWLVALERSLIDLFACVDRSSCRGIGITGQWASTIPVDAGGNAVGRCLLWSDTRAGRYVRPMLKPNVGVAGLGPRQLLNFVRLSGGAPSTQGADPTGHEQLLRHDFADTFARAAYLIEPVDFVAAQLTGRVQATRASMIPSWLTDNRPNATISYHPELVKLAGRDPVKLPPISESGSVLGTVTASAAERYGIGFGLPVIGGLPDLHTAALGAGATRDFEGHIAISTSAWVSAPVPFKKTDVSHQMATVPGWKAGSYLIANNHETGGACLRWWRDGHDEPVTFDQLADRAAAAPSGSGGVIFTPWLQGERSPVDDRHLRSSFLNVSMRTTQAHLTRAIFEGVAMNARWLLEASEDCAGQRLTELCLLGGGAQSELWCQIHADVINRPIRQVSMPMHVNVRGAARYCALRLGDIVEDDMRAAHVSDRIFSPTPSSAAELQRLYDVFVNLAKDQRAMYRTLNAPPKN
jgi:xylulokinase